MAPKRASNQKSQATTSGTAEKQAPVLVITNKRLTGEFNPDHWTSNHRMIWGGAMIKEYLVATIENQADRMLVLDMLEKAQIKGFPIFYPQWSFFNGCVGILQQFQDYFLC